MATTRTLLIQRGRRAVRRLRAATLIYGGAEIPCTAGNEDFFERLAENGFQTTRACSVSILRSDISAGLVFKRGESVQVRDEESGDIYDLQVGDGNSRQAALFILNLEALPS